VWVAALVITLVLAATASPENTGDALDYARDAAAASSLASPSLYEPGHLLWRPAGVVLRNAEGRTPSSDFRAISDEQRTLTRLSMVAGFIAAAIIGLFVLQVVQSLPAALLAVLLTSVGAAFLNFSQTGSSYVPGLACVSLGLWLGAGAQPGALFRPLCAGLVLALGVLLWLPYVLVVPAVLLAIGFLAEGAPNVRVRGALLATGACAILGLVAYGAAASSQGVANATEFSHWVGSSSHGIARPGLTRVALGLPRSFVHMGNDGREVRRYLMRDTLNPVSRGDVLRLHVWPKLALFYSALALVAVFAVRRPVGRSLLLLLLVAALPVIGLGAAWSGGEEERYLPLYPFLLLLVTWSASMAARQGNRLVPVAVGLLALMFAGNVRAFGPWAAHERSRDAQARLGCAVALFNDHSVIVVPERSDPLVTFTRDRLDEPPRNAGTPVVYLLPPNTVPGLTWDQTLAEMVARARTAGGRVWVPGYAVDSLPPRWSGWVEGSHSVTWRQVRQAFISLPLRQTCTDTALLEVVPR